MGGPAVCTFCGASLLPEDRFCPACGRGVGLPDAPIHSLAQPLDRPPPAEAPAWRHVALWGAAWAAGPILYGLGRGNPGAWVMAGGAWFLGGVVAGSGMRRALAAERRSPSVQFLLATTLGWAFLMGLPPWIHRLMALSNTPYVVRDLVAVTIFTALAGAAGAWIARREASAMGPAPASPLWAGVGWGGGAALPGLLQFALMRL